MTYDVNRDRCGFGGSRATGREPPGPVRGRARPVAHGFDFPVERITFLVNFPARQEFLPAADFPSSRKDFIGRNLTNDSY